MSRPEIDPQPDLSTSLFGIVAEWDAERTACNHDAEQLGARRGRNREREKQILARLPNEGGSVIVAGWLITVQPDGKGLCRTRIGPSPASSAKGGEP